MYTPDFKLTVVKRVPDAKSYTALGRELGIESSTIRNWYAEYRKYGEQAFKPGGKAKSEEDRLRKLEKENAEFREENAILKKATAFFAKEHL